MTYAISISGFKHELITKPFLAVPIPLDFFVMLGTRHEKSRETCKKVSEFLDFANVRTVVKVINNIYDFYEIYIALETVKKDYGLPNWINVTPGPGIAIASLTFFAMNNRVPVVSYNVETNSTSIIDVYNSKNILAFMQRGIKVLEVLGNGQKSFDELSSALGVSKSTISRKVSDLKAVSLVETKLEKRTVVVSLSPAGEQVIGSSIEGTSNRLTDP
jgi:CRISPR locus-related DNA-binding protein